jgi:putative ABC transport system permease protein
METIVNHLRIAYRNFGRHRLHAGINISGLAVGLALAILILLYVAHELSHDRFHSNAERIYLLPMVWHFGETEMPTAANCSGGGPFMKATFPEVEESVRIASSSLALRKGDQPILEPAVYFADEAFFRVFSFPLLSGDGTTALSRPNSIVLTRRMARKYFGDEVDPIEVVGQSLTTTGKATYLITGVMEDLPDNTHMKFDFVASITSLPARRIEPSWNNSEFYTYLLLAEGASGEALKPRIREAAVKVFGEDLAKVVELDLVPLRDVYLRNPRYPVPNGSDIFYVRVFSITALLVILIATVNYVNMATARSMERAREVGVRKVMGALRTQLFRQFLTESTLTTGISIALALGFAILSLPAFNHVSGKSLDASQLLTLGPLASIALGGIILSVLAGAYPALVLSAYAPVKVLKGKLRDSRRGIQLRKGLVITQFLISAVLIVCTLLIGRQVQYVQSKSLGFDHHRLVSLSLDSAAGMHLDALKARLQSATLVAGSTVTYQTPIRITHGTGISLANETEKDRKILNAIAVDSDFIQVLGLQVAAGRTFTAGMERSENGMEIILNQSAAAFFGWSEGEAIGKELKVWGGPGVVTGVVIDFRFNSVHSPVKPLVIFSGGGSLSALRNLIVRVEGNPEDVKEQLGRAWSEVNPDSPFTLTYLDDQYASLYKRETRLLTVANVFSGLSIFISLLGLFGLASYAITQRTKELGIRKVLGATYVGLVRLVSADFLRMVAAAYLLAAPICWYVMRMWLDSFSERVSFDWLLVVWAAVATIVLAMLIILYHASTVARLNPSDTLRTE